MITLLFPTIQEIPAKLIPPRIESQKLYQINNTFRFALTGPGYSVSNFIEKNYLSLKNDLLIIIGYAGALDKSLKSGDIIICNQFLSESNTIPGICCKIFTDIHKQFKKSYKEIFIGSSFTTTKIVNQTFVKEKLEQKGARVVEMENYWAAQTAQKHSINLAGIRIILDTFHDNLPDLSNTITCDGYLSIANTLKHIMYHPYHLMNMIHLYFLTKKADPQILKCCEIISAFTDF